MLYYERISVFEETDGSKTSASIECDVCHYSHFLDKGFKFPQNVVNWCHAVLMMFVNLGGISRLKIQNFDYCYIIKEISKRDAVNLLQNADLIEKRGII